MNTNVIIRIFLGVSVLPQLAFIYFKVIEYIFVFHFIYLTILFTFLL